MDPPAPASSAGPGAREERGAPNPSARLQGEAVDPHGHRVRLPRLQDGQVRVGVEGVGRARCWARPA